MGDDRFVTTILQKPISLSSVRKMETLLYRPAIAQIQICDVKIWEEKMIWRYWFEDSPESGGDLPDEDREEFKLIISR